MIEVSGAGLTLTRLFEPPQTVQAGIRGCTLIVNLPGSPKAVREGMEVPAPLLPAIIALIGGEMPVDGLCTP